MNADFAYAVRTFRKTPGLTLVALLCLAAAIGLSTAAFSVIHGTFFASLPVPGGKRFVTVREYLRSGRYDLPMTAAQFTLRQERSQSFEALGAWYGRKVSIAAQSSEGTGGLVRAAYVSVNTLPMLALAPELGRHFTAADVAPGASPVVMLSDDLWRTRFVADPAILDRAVSIAGTLHRVVGVMPRGIRFPVRDDLWIPIQTDSRAANATSETMVVFGRLKPGVSVDRAVAELATIAASDRTSPLDPAKATVPLVMPFPRGFMTPDEEWALYGFLAGMVLFLVVIAANLANLFFARNATRTREMTVRAALGASRARLVRQVLGESLLLASAGAVAGLAVSRLALAWFQSQVDDLPWWADFGVNLPVLLFVGCAAIVASAVAGVGPALRLTRASIAESLKDGSPGVGGLRFSRIGAALVVAEVAISVGFLSVVGVLAQGLFGFSYQRFQLPGDEVLVSQVYLGPPPNDELAAAGAVRRDVWRRHFERSSTVLERMRAELASQPGVRSVTFSTHFPGNDVEAARIELEAGVTPGTYTTRIAQTGPAFFEVLGAPVTAGRDFLPAERSGPRRAVIVNAPFAAKYFAGRNPIGQRLRLAGEDEGTPGPWMEIVGVVPDLGLNPGDPRRADGIYVPFAPSSFARFAVRTTGQPSAFVPRLHDVITRAYPTAQVQSAETLTDLMQSAERVFRGLGTGLSLVGLTALVLSAVSLYSLISFGVTRRTREIGVRVALGASRAQILRSVLGRELTLMSAGAGAGVMIGLGLYRVVTLLPFDMGPAGPWLLAGFVGLMLTVGVGACFVPARRAAAIQPASALRI